MAVKIRNATEADIPVLIEMGQALHDESPRYSRMGYSPEKVESLIRSMITGTLVTEAVGGALVAEKDGKIVGMMGGFITEPFFSHDKIASDYTFYVRPEHRGKGRVAIGLVKAFEAWAIARGAIDIIPGTCTEIKAEATVSFYEKLGYERYGYAMIKRIK